MDLNTPTLVHVGRPMSHVTVIPNRVPPPTGLPATNGRLATAKRTKDGYFIVSPKTSTESVKSSKNGSSGKQKKEKVFIHVLLCLSASLAT